MEVLAGSAMMFIFAIVAIIATLRLSKIEADKEKSQNQERMDAYWRGVNDGKRGHGRYPWEDSKESEN